MAHFAQLDENNTVIQVIVVANEVLMIDGAESEDAGIVFCKSLYGIDTRWKQTSYNSNFRKHYAGIGYTYDPVLNAFIPPKPFPSWLLNTDTCNWEPPVPMPDDGNMYTWDEDTMSWVKVDSPVI